MLELPIAETTLQKIKEAIDTGEERTLLESFSHAQLAAIVFLLKSPGLDYTSSPDEFTQNAEHIMAKLIIIARDDKPALIKMIVATISTLCHKELLNKLNRYDVYCMNESEVGEEGYLTPAGDWDYKYRDSSRLQGLTDRIHNNSNSGRLFTEDQARLLNTYIVEPEEGMHVQAVAGSGKTSFISYAVENLKDEEVLVAAMTWQQIQALKLKVKKPVQFATFIQLADRVIKESSHIHIPNFWERKKMRHGIQYSLLANVMGYQKLDRLSEKQVAETVNKTVNRFCYSTDSDITLNHIPKQSQYYLPVHQQEIIVELAKKLWQQIISPDHEFINFPIHGFHRIKLWAMSGVPIPTEYKFVFADEAHDLPNPIIQILDRSPQGVVTLGDQYQAVGRVDQLQKRSHLSRHRTMNTSFRVGRNSSGLFNLILDHHPDKKNFDFEGRRNKTTRVTLYNRGSAKPYESGPCTILSKDCWHLLKVMLFLSNHGSKFAIQRPTDGDLKWIVSDAINFYRSGDRPTHRAFYKYDTWQAFYDNQRKDVQSIIDKTILKGFNEEHLAKHLGRAIEPGRGTFLLAKTSDTKNMEFSRVMLLEDLMSIEEDNIVTKSDSINLIYLAASRAIDEIIIPEHLEDWISASFKY